MTADPRIALHADLRRAHTLAARAINAATSHYSGQPGTVGALVEATQILHAIMERAEGIIRADLDRDANRHPTQPSPRWADDQRREPDPSWMCPKGHPANRRSRRSDGRTYCLECTVVGRRRRQEQAA